MSQINILTPKNHNHAIPKQLCTYKCPANKDYQKFKEMHSPKQEIKNNIERQQMSEQAQLFTFTMWKCNHRIWLKSGGPQLEMCPFCSEKEIVKKSVNKMLFFERG